jgi:aminoglycoside phosphotransferase (APT) family kinase protein
MPSSTETATEVQAASIVDGLRRLAALPDWIVVATRSERVIAALQQQVPEVATGAIRIQRCKLDRLRLKNGYWEALYELKVDGPDEQTGRAITLAGTLTPPGSTRPDQAPDGGAFGSAEWRCYLPELRLDLWTSAEEEQLEALPLLTDPEQARAFLEQSIGQGSAAYAGLHIQQARPKVMRNKPGRCTVLYQLEYADTPAAARWPNPVIGKTYSGSKGQNAYDGMRKLWDSPLSKGDIVSIAEPLAYIPEHKVLVQGPVHGDQDLKDLLRASLRAGTAEAIEELHQIVRKTAAGLAALHQSGARHGETRTWEDELAEIREEIDKLSTVVPWFAEATMPLLARLASIAAEHPAEPTVPTHHSFRPQQVRIHGQQIGFIDFDGFGLAEPALDVALLRATAREFGINTSPSEKQKEFEYTNETARLARLVQMDTLCEIFLAEYQQHTPVSRRRVVLWEALYLLTVVLRCWTKVKPHQLSNAIALLEQYLHTSELQSE